MELRVKDLYKDMPDEGAVVTVMKDENQIVVLRSFDRIWKTTDAILAEFKSERKAEEFAIKLAMDLVDPYSDVDATGEHSS